jgi:hypothetical protein
LSSHCPRCCTQTALYDTPGRLIFGLPSPSSMRTMSGPPFINFQSSGLTEAFYQDFVIPRGRLVNFLASQSVG